MSAQYDSLRPILERPSAWVVDGEEFLESFDENLEILQSETRVLVVGAGGLGCEVLKNLALSGFKEIHLIDMDTIDVSNLNRQFLFRKKDCGKYKAEVAAAFIMQRCPGVNVTAYTKPIQDFARDWYSQFNIVIAGLDNIAARSWLNETLVDLVTFDKKGRPNHDTIIPLIDGGTEGFGGQSRVFIPRVTSCFECSLASMPANNNHFHLCTIANVPRIPEHCIQYALQIQWPLLEEFKSCTDYKMYERKDEKDETAPGGVKLDKDDPEHMTWLFNRSTERAEKYNIKGVTYNLTMQVVKNIIPAIASTNALISAECVNEALKYRVSAARRLDNYFMYMGGMQTGTNCQTFKYQRNPECHVCHEPLKYTLPSSTTLQQFLTKLETEAKLDGPTVSMNGGRTLIYMKKMHDTYAADLEKPLFELGVSPGGQLLVAQDENQRVQKIILKLV